MGTVAVDTLPAGLAKLGWETEPSDICWLDCEREGFRLETGGWETILCVRHAVELESTSQEGHSLADPPRDSRAKWWPWRPVGTEDRECSGLEDPVE
jgi:hypothetical protein